MTHRERLLAPFKGITPDQPAWLADLGYWYPAMKDRGLLEPQYQDPDGYLQLHADLGVCAYYGQGGSTFARRQDGVEAGSHEDGGVRIRWWRTPLGEISNRYEFIPTSHSWAHVEYAVKSLDDLRVVQDIYARTSIEPNYEPFISQSERLGDAGLPISPAPRSPVPALMTDWCGVVTTSYLLADELAAIEDTLALIDQSSDAAIEAMCESPAELFHFADNLDSNNYTSLFEPYMEEYYRRRLGQVHAAGKFAVTHLDGAVRGLLPRLADVGFDGVEAITTGPVGDVEIEELRELCGEHDTIIWGGVPGAMFSPPWTAAQIRENTVRLLDEMAPDNRLIVGSADQIPPDGDIEFCGVVADTITERVRG